MLDARSGSAIFARAIAAAAVASLAMTGRMAHATPERADQVLGIALALEANVKHGAALYVRQCARCHGPAATGDPLNVTPSLAGQRRAYLIKELADFAEVVRNGDEMHKVISRAEVAEPQAWADLAAYLNDLAPASAPEHGDGTGLKLGEAIFREQCATCHENDARGDDEGFVPSLRSQHYAYLLKQMRSIGSWHRETADAGLVRFLDSLQTDELTAVADYLSRMRGPVRDRAKLRPDGSVDD